MMDQLMENRTFSQHGFALLGAGGAGAAASSLFGISPAIGAAVAILSCIVERVKEVVLKHPFIASNFIQYDERKRDYSSGLHIPSWSGVGRFTVRHCVRAGMEIGKVCGLSRLASITFPHAWVIGALGSHGARLGISLYECGVLASCKDSSS